MALRSSSAGPVRQPTYASAGAFDPADWSGRLVDHGQVPPRGLQERTVPLVIRAALQRFAGQPTVPGWAVRRVDGSDPAGCQRHPYILALPFWHWHKVRDGEPVIEGRAGPRRGTAVADPHPTCGPAARSRPKLRTCSGPRSASPSWHRPSTTEAVSLRFSTTSTCVAAPEAPHPDADHRLPLAQAPVSQGRSYSRARAPTHRRRPGNSPTARTRPRPTAPTLSTRPPARHAPRRSAETAPEAGHSAIVKDHEWSLYRTPS